MANRSINSQSQIRLDRFMKILGENETFFKKKLGILYFSVSHSSFVSFFSSCFVQFGCATKIFIPIYYWISSETFALRTEIIQTHARAVRRHAHEKKKNKKNATTKTTKGKRPFGFYEELAWASLYLSDVFRKLFVYKWEFLECKFHLIAYQSSLPFHCCVLLLQFSLSSFLSIPKMK